MRGNLHRPYGFGRNGTVFGVAPPHNVEALVPRRSPKSGTVALRNLVTLSLAGTTRSLRGPSVLSGQLRRSDGFGLSLFPEGRRLHPVILKRGSPPFENKLRGQPQIIYKP